jgi:ABC-2 type transport system permease protein
MMGPADTDHYTLGVMTAHNMLLFTAIAVALMSILLLTRHTRGEEEDGQSELLLALPVGKVSNLNAALLVLTGAHLVLAVITGFGLYALGFGSMGLEGSLLYGAALGGTGIFFAGAAAVFAQLTVSSRGAAGLSIGFLIAAYLLRAMGDVSNETLSLFSPLGLVTQIDVYAGNNWWPVAVLILVSVLLFILANYLNAIREWGSGFIHARAGRKHASRFLRSPVGLAFRIQRTGFIAWTVGLFVLGASYGSVMGDLEAFFQGNKLLEELLLAAEGYTLTEQFVPMLMLVMAIIAVIPPIIAMNKLAAEERKNRTEQLLSLPLSRTKLIGSYLLLSVFNGFIMLSATVIGLWLAAESVMEEGFAFGTLYGAALAYYPAVLIFIGLAAFLVGWAPRLTGFIWIYLIYTFFISYLGGLFQLPEWLGKLSPFGYIPGLPVEDMDWMPVLVLTILAIILMLFGLAGYRKRDISG